MQVEHSIIILWILCSMLACWAFSLVVRWLSDRHARRVDRLKRQYSSRSRWLAGALVLLCAAGSALAGGSAAYISAQPGVGGMRLTPLGAIGLGMMCFGSLLIVWGAIGDRSRGRMRCPRCWYDMRDSEGRPCPECGYVARGKNPYNRTRRPRWAFLVALLFLIAGSAGLGLNTKLRDQGWAGFVPNQILLSNWEKFPESWVHDIGIGADQHDLSERIRVGDVSDAERHAFTESLIDEMILDPYARWEERRMSLLAACMRREVGMNYDFDEEKRLVPIWVPSEGRLERLYRACIKDLLKYYQRESVPIEEELEIDIMHSLSMWRGNTHQVTREWLLICHPDEQLQRLAYRRSLNHMQVSYLSAMLGDLPEQFLRFNDDSMYTEPEPQRALEMLGLESETGVLRQRVSGLMAWYESNLNAENAVILRAISSGLSTTPEDGLDEPMDLILRWLGDGDLELRKTALRVIAAVYAFDSRSGRTGNSARVEELINAIRAHALQDQRKTMEGPGTQLVAHQAMGTIGAIDADGLHFFTLLRDMMLDSSSRDTALMHSDIYLYRYGSQQILNWINTFEPLLTGTHPDVKVWIARQIPRRKGSEHDERLNAMVRVLMEDPDSEVREVAITRAMDRGID